MTDIETASLADLKKMRKKVKRQIDTNWADRDFLLRRDRYEVHDTCVALLRKIDERISKFEQV